MKPDKAIDRLEEDFDPYRECPTLLDVGMAEPFLQWLNDNIEYLEHLEQKRWRIGVLSRHLAARLDLEASLKNVGIEILDDHFTDSDEALVMEMLHAYFGGNGVYRKAAQLLAYGRKHFEESDDVQVISRLRVFRLIPKVQLYFIPGVDYRGNDEELYYLRLLDVLKIHSKVQDAAYTRIMNGDYPVAVSEATKTLIDEVRKIGNVHGLSFAQNTSDQPMIDQAIRNEEHDKSSGKKKEVNPAIQLNDLKNSSDKSEQKGYRDLMCGVVNAVRNPTAHAPVDEPSIRERFSDRRTALKFLCLLSLLFEKLDDRVAPK